MQSDYKHSAKLARNTADYNSSYESNHDKDLPRTSIDADSNNNDQAIEEKDHEENIDDYELSNRNFLKSIKKIEQSKPIENQDSRLQFQKLPPIKDGFKISAANTQRGLMESESSQFGFDESHRFRQVSNTTTRNLQSIGNNTTEPEDIVDECNYDKFTLVELIDLVLYKRLRPRLAIDDNRLPDSIDVEKKMKRIRSCMLILLPMITYQSFLIEMIPASISIILIDNYNYEPSDVALLISFLYIPAIP